MDERKEIGLNILYARQPIASYDELMTAVHEAFVELGKRNNPNTSQKLLELGVEVVMKQFEWDWPLISLLLESYFQNLDTPVYVC